MQVNAKNLEKFHAWLLARGRTEGTADVYLINVRTCGADPKGITHRLVGGDLAPKTRRLNLAALRAWAKFGKDLELADVLSDLRLPPARRQKAKIPLDQPAWRAIVQHIQHDAILTEPMRHTLLIMARRGLRCSDVLRMRRTDIVRAIDTGRLVYEGKGRKRIEIDATPIMPSLEALRGFKGWDRVRELISTSTAPIIARKSVIRASKTVGKDIGIEDMTPHRFRHTFATRFLAELQGDPNALVKLQRFMDWESIQTASGYVNSVSGSELDRVGASLVSLLDAGASSTSGVSTTRKVRRRAVVPGGRQGR